MNGPRSAIVFFSYPDADDEKEDAVRQQTLARGTDEILANVAGVTGHAVEQSLLHPVGGWKFGIDLAPEKFRHR
jgi:hypothetical protein